MSHYEWLDKNFNIFMFRLGLNSNDCGGIIVAHGDKCEGYRNMWKMAGIPFNHGIAIYLLTYIKPYSDTVRMTSDGWVSPVMWVIDHYKEFKDLLPAA